MENDISSFLSKKQILTKLKSTEHTFLYTFENEFCSS